MTIPPQMNLPESAMPWGRWFMDEAAAAWRGLEAADSDADSFGAQFRAQSDNISRTISQFASRRTGVLRPPNINSFASGSVGWIAVGQDVSFAALQRVRREAMMIIGFTVPRAPFGTISPGPNYLRVLVNGAQAGGLLALNRAGGPAVLPIDSTRVPFRVPITIQPGAVNTIRMELGSYMSVSSSYSFSVNASDIEIALTFEDA